MELPRPLSSRCAKCSAELISEITLCMRCRERNYAFSSNRSLFRYAGWVRDLLHSYKFEGVSTVTEFFAAEIAQYYESARLSQPIVPVPPRPGQPRKSRHVERIARLLGKHFGIEVTRSLERRDGVAQKTLDYEGRVNNLRDVFSVVDFDAVIGARLLILDDVMTTGATLDE